jgi:hypothetical protein
LGLILVSVHVLFLLLHVLLIFLLLLTKNSFCEYQCRVPVPYRISGSVLLNHGPEKDPSGVADPDPEFGALLTPRIRDTGGIKNQDPDPG